MKRLTWIPLFFIALLLVGCSSVKVLTTIDEQIVAFEDTRLDTHLTQVEMSFDIDVLRETQQATLTLQNSTASLSVQYNTDMNFLSYESNEQNIYRSLIRIEPYDDHLAVQVAQNRMLYANTVSLATQPYYVNQMVMDTVHLIKDLKLPEDAKTKKLNATTYQVSYDVPYMIENNSRFWQFVSLGYAVDQDLSEGQVVITHTFDPEQKQLHSTLHMDPFRIDEVRTLFLQMDITQTVTYVDKEEMVDVDWDYYMAYPAASDTDPMVMLSNHGNSTVYVTPNSDNYYGLHLDEGTYTLRGSGCTMDPKNTFSFGLYDQDMNPVEGDGTFVIETAGDYILKIHSRKLIEDNFWFEVLKSDV